MHKVIYPGSFDPATNGHLNVIHRASKMFDQVEVVISSNPQKKVLFTAEERLGMMQEMTADLKNVHVHTWPGLVVDFARKSGIRTILRGVRALVDFEYEFELYMMNHALNPDIETIFIPTDQKYFVLRSSGIKEVVLFGGDVSDMVPPVVVEALKKKLANVESPLD
jgi:pantetheine-phosphate adenylyltransferase